MNKRIIGIDVARALSIFGMIIVNFKMVFGQQGQGWLKSFSEIFDGKAAATFVVLAGVGIAFMTNVSIRDNDEKRLRESQIVVLKRALFLFVVGLSYNFIWPADILHFYGIYMLAVLLFVKSKPHTILIAALVLVLFYPVLMLLIDYEAGWDFNTLQYDGFWSVDGFFRNLFYNGFHPVIPWAAFMLIGLWFGRQNLNDDQFVKKTLWISLSMFLVINLVSKLLIHSLSGSSEQVAGELAQVLGTSPMPPLPIYMLSGSSIAIFIVSGCILIARRFENNVIISALNKTGQLTLTFYVAHVIIGMGVVEEVSSTKLGMHSLEFSVIYALVFSLLCIVFALVWTKYCNVGPLEWIMRKLTD